MLRSLFAEKPEILSSHCVIGHNVVIRGSLRSEGDVYLSGKVQGKIECRRLFITKEGGFGHCDPLTEIIHLASFN